MIWALIYNKVQKFARMLGKTPLNSTVFRLHFSTQSNLKILPNIVGFGNPEMRDHKQHISKNTIPDVFPSCKQ